MFGSYRSVSINVSSFVRGRRLGVLAPLWAALALSAGVAVAGCASGGSDSTAGSGQDVTAGPGAHGTLQLDAPLAKLISSTKGFNPKAPLFYPPTMPVQGLFPRVITDGVTDGYIISFDLTAACSNPNGCGVIWLTAESPDLSSDGSDIILDGTPPKSPLGNNIKAVYDGVGGAHGNPSISWRMTGVGSPAKDYDYSINFDAAAASFTEDQMIAFAKAAIANGPRTPMDILMKQLRASSPNFHPKTPVSYPPSLPVGGLFPTIIESGDLNGGYNISFDPAPTCDNTKDGCGFIWIVGEPPDLSSDGSDIILDGTPPKSPLGDNIKAVYDGEGGAHGNPSIAWGMNGADYSVNFAAGAESFTEDQMIQFAKDQIAAAPKQQH